MKRSVSKRHHRQKDNNSSSVDFRSAVSQSCWIISSGLFLTHPGTCQFADALPKCMQINFGSAGLLSRQILVSLAVHVLRDGQEIRVVGWALLQVLRAFGAAGERTLSGYFKFLQLRAEHLPRCDLPISHLFTEEDALGRATASGRHSINMGCSSRIFIYIPPPLAHANDRQHPHQAHTIFTETCSGTGSQGTIITKRQWETEGEAGGQCATGAVAAQQPISNEKLFPGDSSHAMDFSLSSSLSLLDQPLEWWNWFPRCLIIIWYPPKWMDESAIDFPTTEWFACLVLTEG